MSALERARHNEIRNAGAKRECGFLDGPTMTRPKRFGNLRVQALKDPLTGLASARTAEVFLRNRLKQERTAVVLLVDLKSFKRINQEFGRECGDQILAAAGQELAREVKSFQVVCRWKGAQFLAISTHGDFDLESVKIRICEMLSRTYEVLLGEEPLDVSVSVAVGIAKAEPGENMSSLLDRAESVFHST